MLSTYLSNTTRSELGRAGIFNHFMVLEVVSILPSPPPLVPRSPRMLRTTNRDTFDEISANGTEGMDWKERRARQEQEIAALKEALAILSEI